MPCKSICTVHCTDFFRKYPYGIFNIVLPFGQLVKFRLSTGKVREEAASTLMLAVDNFGRNGRSVCRSAKVTYWYCFWNALFKGRKNAAGCGWI